MAGKKHTNISATTQKTPEAKGAPVKKESAASFPKWVLAVVLAGTALLYSKAVWNGITFMDDDFYILTNPFIRNFSLKGVFAIFTSFYNYNYHPLTTLTDLFIFKWFGLDPLPYHLLNVLLHLVNVWLVFRLATQLSHNKITSLVVAVLFAIHPMHVESVAWISERKDVLYATFYLASLLLYLRYITSGFRTKHYAVALLLFLASLFSKSAAVTLPILLIAIDLYKGRKINGRLLMEKMPFFLLSAIFGILAIKSQSSGGAFTDLSLYFGFVNRLFLFTSGIAFYFIKIIAPFDLNTMHFYPEIHGWVLPWHYYLSLPFLLILAWLAARKNSYRKEIVFGIVFFLVTISVMLQIVPVGTTMVAERYTYIPYIGLFYIAGQWIAGNYGKHRKFIVPVFSLFILAFTIQTWFRIDTWQDTGTLFADIINKNPGNWRNGLVYNSWGDFEKYNGDNKEALQKYSEAIQLIPGYELALYNQGNIYNETGDVRSALNDYNKVISIDPKPARYYNSRGWAYYQLGDKNAALRDYDKAISINPNNAEEYNNRGWAYYQSGELKLSALDFNKAIEISPGFIKPYFNRASVKANSGDLTGAIEDYNLILKLNPNDSLAYYNRGIIHLNQKDSASACTDWKKSLDLGYKEAQGVVRQYCH